MKIKQPLAISVLILVASCPLPSASEQPPCKETQAGRCFTVHGRYSIYANRDGIWIIGTRRVLNANSDELDHKIQQAGGDYDHSIYGDFTVCPETKYEPGHLQTACIQSYKNINLEKYR
jgi:hypothetical protein